MFSSFRNRFGIPGVISVIALVFAMIGGAYAANNSGSGEGATASAKKAVKGPPGKRGPKGATGAAGPAGPAGPAGAKGDTGAAGVAGEKGATGSDGVSVTSSVEPKGANCAEGGSKFVSSSGTTFACNGKPGAKGEPWTPDGVLPEGATLTGAWTTIAPRKATVNFEAETFENTAKGEAMNYAFSFPLPLASEPTPVYVGTAASDVGAGCPGIVDGTPTADPGKLCVYTGSQQGSPAAVPLFLKPIGSFQSGASKTGTVISFICEVSACSRTGTWAVTAPEA
jgi:Collagen triple helix repeat (20 copies)